MPHCYRVFTTVLLSMLIVQCSGVRRCGAVCSDACVCRERQRMGVSVCRCVAACGTTLNWKVAEAVSGSNRTVAMLHRSLRSGCGVLMTRAACAKMLRCYLRRCTGVVVVVCVDVSGCSIHLPFAVAAIGVCRSCLHVHGVAVVVL
jgi:hypothetical protein